MWRLRVDLWGLLPCWFAGCTCSSLQLPEVHGRQYRGSHLSRAGARRRPSLQSCRPWGHWPGLLTRGHLCVADIRAGMHGWWELTRLGKEEGKEASWARGSHGCGKAASAFWEGHIVPCVCSRVCFGTKGGKGSSRPNSQAPGLRMR